MVRLLGETSGIREAIATAIVALSAVFAMYAVAAVIGPTPIPSFVVLPTFAVGFLLAALFAYTLRPRRVRFALTAAVVTATAVYGGSWLLYGAATARSTATFGVFGFVLVALGLGAGAVWLAEDTARFIEGEATADNGFPAGDQLRSWISIGSRFRRQPARRRARPTPTGSATSSSIPPHEPPPSTPPPLTRVTSP